MRGLARAYRLRPQLPGPASRMIRRGDERCCAGYAAVAGRRADQRSGRSPRCISPSKISHPIAAEPARHLLRARPRHLPGAACAVSRALVDLRSTTASSGQGRACCARGARTAVSTNCDFQIGAEWGDAAGRDAALDSGRLLRGRQFVFPAMSQDRSAYVPRAAPAWSQRCLGF